MLSSLRLRNMATISDASVELGDGLNVLTGETGAGKSMIVGGLLLALGERADRSVVRAGEKVASVEAVFDVPGRGSLLVRREVHSAGRSRLLVDDEVRTLEELRAVLGPLVELHTQRSAPALLRKPVQRRYLDEYAGAADLAELVAGLFQEIREADAGIEELSARLASAELDTGVLTHELGEIERLNPSREEFDGLREEREALLRAKQRCASLDSIVSILSEEEPSVSSMLSAAAALARKGGHGEETGQAIIEELIEQASISVTEIVSRCNAIIGTYEASPWRVEEVDARLDDYSRLLERYGGSIDELIARRDVLESRLAEISAIDESLRDLRETRSRQVKRLLDNALDLSGARTEAAERLSSAVREELSKLGMPDVRFEVGMESPGGGAAALELEGRSISSCGLEDIEFLFSANPGSPPASLSSVASGGELSRASLALRLALAQVRQPSTMVFDEIDSGVGGETAHLLADALERATLGGRRQVIVITHLAQIACRADTHLAVSKTLMEGLPETAVRSLDRFERIEELTRVLGGGAAAEEHARALMDRKRD